MKTLDIDRCRKQFRTWDDLFRKALLANLRDAVQRYGSDTHPKALARALDVSLVGDTPGFLVEDRHCCDCLWRCDITRIELFGKDDILLVGNNGSECGSFVPLYTLDDLWTAGNGR